MNGEVTDKKSREEISAELRKEKCKIILEKEISKFNLG